MGTCSRCCEDPHSPRRQIPSGAIGPSELGASYSSKEARNALLALLAQLNSDCLPARGADLGVLRRLNTHSALSSGSLVSPMPQQSNAEGWDGAWKRIDLAFTKSQLRRGMAASTHGSLTVGDDRI